MAGYGANFISSLAVREYVESGHLARVYVKDIHAVKHKIAICTRNNEKQNLLVQKFIETIKNSPFKDLYLMQDGRKFVILVI